MEYLNFKLLHLLGILCLFSGIGGMFFASYLEAGAANRSVLRLPRMLHGLGMLFILVGGFMMVHALGLHGENGVPLWVKLKLGILVLFGPLIVLVRSPSQKKLLLPIAIVLGLAATALALYKPF
jgi:hypothetical protein